MTCGNNKKVTQKMSRSKQKMTRKRVLTYKEGGKALQGSLRAL